MLLHCITFIVIHCDRIEPYLLFATGKEIKSNIYLLRSRSEKSIRVCSELLYADKLLLLVHLIAPFRKALQLGEKITVFVYIDFLRIPVALVNYS